MDHKEIGQLDYKALNDLLNSANKLFPLYHGTDLRIAKMSKKERAAFKSDIDKISAALWQVYKLYVGGNGLLPDALKNKFKGEQGMTQWLNLANALICYHAMLHGNKQYQYNSFHLTNFRTTAENYARKAFAFGETGLLAYRMFDAMRVLQLPEWNPSKEISDALKRLVDFAEDDKHATPVLFEFYNLDFNHIEIECEGSVWDYLTKMGRFSHDIGLVVHYDGRISLNPSKAIPLHR